MHVDVDAPGASAGGRAKPGASPGDDGGASDFQDLVQHVSIWFGTSGLGVPCQDSRAKYQDSVTRSNFQASVFAFWYSRWCNSCRSCPLVGNTAIGVAVCHGCRPDVGPIVVHFTDCVT